MKKFFYLPLIALALNACGGGDKGAATAASQAAAPQAQSNQPVVRVAVEPVYPPFVQQLPQGGYEGFDVALMNEIAKRQGFQVNYMPTVWAGIFDRLANGEMDVVIGGVAIAADRKEKVDFSESYLTNHIVFVVKENSPLTTVEQVLNGKRIAYQNETFSSAELSKLQNGKLDKTLGEGSAWKTIQRVMVNDGRQVDAAIGDSFTTNYYMLQYKDQHLRTIVANNLPSEEVAFAVKKGNTDLLNKLNQGLAAVKADGTFDKLKHEWLDNAHQHSENESSDGHSEKKHDEHQHDNHKH